jgi:hypothetical protein
MSVPSQDMDFNVICHGLLYIQCLFQARTWISTSYVMVFYIFNVCSKPGHVFQNIHWIYKRPLHMTLKSMSWLRTDIEYIKDHDIWRWNPCPDLEQTLNILKTMTYDVGIHVLAWNRHWIYKRPWHMTLKSMSWLGTDIEYIKDHDIWRWNPCPGLEQTLNI